MRAIDRLKKIKNRLRETPHNLSNEQAEKALGVWLDSLTIELTAPEVFEAFIEAKSWQDVSYKDYLNSPKRRKELAEFVASYKGGDDG